MFIRHCFQLQEVVTLNLGYAHGQMIKLISLTGHWAVGRQRQGALALRVTTPQKAQKVKGPLTQAAKCTHTLLTLLCDECSKNKNKLKTFYS